MYTVYCLLKLVPFGTFSPWVELQSQDCKVVNMGKRGMPKLISLCHKQWILQILLHGALEAGIHQLIACLIGKVISSK